MFHNSPLCFELESWPPRTHIDVMEVGAGTGLFGLALAGKDAITHYLAVDVKADRLQVGARQAAENNIKNIRFLRARVDQLTAVIAPHSLREIWITFPDPFPKDRSAKHRLTHPQFLDVYRQLLSESGTLYFKTDAKDLFDWSLEQLDAQKWNIQELSFDLHDSDLAEHYKIPTTYEKRYMNEGKKINFVRAIPKQ